MDRERSYIITAVLIIINFTVRSDGFLWNQQSIEQLFGNSDAVFNRVGQTIALDQQDCVADFKGFINGVRHGEQWAIRSKSESLVMMTVRFYYLFCFQCWIRGVKCRMD